MSDQTPGAVVATVTQTDMPGLVNVQTTDGRQYSDLTLGQLGYLAAREGWQIVPTDGAK